MVNPSIYSQRRGNMNLRERGGGRREYIYSRVKVKGWFIVLFVSLSLPLLLSNYSLPWFILVNITTSHRKSRTLPLFFPSWSCRLWTLLSLYTLYPSLTDERSYESERVQSWSEWMRECARRGEIMAHWCLTLISKWFDDDLTCRPFRSPLCHTVQLYLMMESDRRGEYRTLVSSLRDSPPPSPL